MTTPPVAFTPGKALAVLALAIGWIVCLRTAFIALGQSRAAARLALFATLVWFLVDRDLLSLTGSGIVWVGLIVVGRAARRGPVVVAAARQGHRPDRSELTGRHELRRRRARRQALLQGRRRQSHQRGRVGERRRHRRQHHLQQQRFDAIGQSARPADRRRGHGRQRVVHRRPRGRARRERAIGFGLAKTAGEGGLGQSDAAAARAPMPAACWCATSTISCASQRPSGRLRRGRAAAAACTSAASRSRSAVQAAANGSAGPAPGHRHRRRGRRVERGARTRGPRHGARSGGQMQVGGLEAVALRQHDRLQDRVLQLADVAGPRVGEQLALGLGREPEQRLALLGGGGPGEVLGQQAHVFGPLAQRRNVQAHDVEAVEEVFAEAAGPHFVLEAPVGGGDDAHVDLARARAADHRDGLLLHEAQQPRLHVERQLANLVEEHRAAVGHGQPAAASAAGRR